MNADKLYVVMLDNKEDDPYIWSGESSLFATTEIEKAKAFAKDKKNWRDLAEEWDKEKGKQIWDVPRIETWKYNDALGGFIPSNEPVIEFDYDGDEIVYDSKE